MKNLYLPLIKKKNRYFHTSRRAAELIKYASNAFLATKISFINEISNLCENTNIDVKEISGIGLDNRIGDRFLEQGLDTVDLVFPKIQELWLQHQFKTNLSILKM